MTGPVPADAPAARPLARWITVAFFVIVTALLVAWAMAVPVFESPDEPAHWQYARHLHDHGSLPFYEPGFEEANSPPLYYLALAPLAVPSRLPPIALAQNLEGQQVGLAPPSVFLHSDRDREWYWPVFAARLLTAVMALLTVWMTYRAGAELIDARGGLTAAAIVAFLPQFSFRNVTVSNDAPVTMFAAAITWTCVRLLQRGFTWRRGVVAALLLAAAYLSKIHAIALLAPLALALIEAPAADTAATRVPLSARVWRLSALLVALIIVLPWSIRNVRLYGDPFASAAMSTAVSHLIGSRSLFDPYFLWHFPKDLTLSFIGIFGWMSILMPKWAYVAFAACSAVVAAGVVRAWTTRTLDRRVARMLVLTVIAIIAIVVYMNLRLTQPQGRYLLPALPALALLSAYGLRSLTPAFAARAHVIVPIALGLFNVWSLIYVLIPAYYPPPMRDVAPGVRVLFPATAYGLQVVSREPSELRFRVAGEDPGWLVGADVDASLFRTLEIELTSDVPGAPTVRGTVFFTSPTEPISGDRRVDFTWTANGARQVVRLDLAAHPQWRGTVAHLRIDPIDDGAAAFISRDVRLGSVRLHRAARTAEEKMTKP